MIENGMRPVRPGEIPLEDHMKPAVSAPTGTTAMLSPHVVMGRPVLSMAAFYQQLGAQLPDETRAKLRAMILEGKKAREIRDALPEVAAMLARIAAVEDDTHRQFLADEAVLKAAK